MKILILGCGAVGGYFGGRLQQAGFNVTFLVREHRKKILDEYGLTIISPMGNANLQVNAITKMNLDDSYDLIILTCKAYDLDNAIEAVTPAVGNKTLIIPLLNGLKHYQKLDDCFGGNVVVGGFCYLSVTMNENGNIHHLSSSHTLTVGARHNDQVMLLDMLLERMATVNFNFRLSNDIIAQLWSKYTFLCAAAALNCMMRGNIGTIMSARFGREIALGILDECNAIATLAGNPLSEDDKKLAQTTLTEDSSLFEASMYKDMKINHHTEYAHIIGDMVRRGAEAGLSIPYLKTALTHLEVYESFLYQ